MWPAIASAVIGGGLGLLGNSMNNKANAEAAEGAGMPMWDPRQEPYLFGSTGWQPQMPEMSADAMNYMTALSGGHNPQYGPQAPMNFEQVLSGILSPQQVSDKGPAWYQDPRSSTQGFNGQPGGMTGLLGYGQGTPPPLFSNNPYFSGQGVMDPQNLMQGPGGYDPANAGYAPPQQQPQGLLGAGGGGAMPAPAPPQPAYMQQDAYGLPAWARDMVM